MNEAKSRCVIRPVTIGDRPASQHDVRQLSVSPSCTSTLNAFARSHANDQLDEPPWLQSMTSPVRRKLFAFGLAIQKRPVAARRRPTLDEGWVCLSCRRQAARGLANIRDDNRKETRQARVRPSFEELQTSLGTHGDRPQPDARTLQLGKSKSSSQECLSQLLTRYSGQRPARSTPYTSGLSSAIGDSIAPDHSTSVSVYAPALADGIWPHRIPRRIVDRACSVGPRACARQHQTGDTLGANGQKRWR